MALFLIICWIGFLAFIGFTPQRDLEFYLFLSWVGLLGLGIGLSAWDILT